MSSTAIVLCFQAETLIVELQSVWPDFREMTLQEVHAKVSASDK